MSQLELIVDDWLGSHEGSDTGLLTRGAFRIRAGSGPDTIPVTEVYDTLARTVRQHIYVQVDLIAHWLLANWWRLRWEPPRSTHEWRVAHSMASIGDGYAWPPVTFSSDGEFVRIRMDAETEPDVAAVRYLRDVSLDVPAGQFETAVDALVRQVRERLLACGGKDEDIEALLAELTDERSDPELSRACRIEARAGFDPGCAPEGWLLQADELTAMAGEKATDEVLAIVPELENGLVTARGDLEQIRSAPDSIDLSWLKPPPSATEPDLPWQKATRLADVVRSQIGWSAGPVTNDKLGELLGVELPLHASYRRPLSGGFRNRTGGERIAIVVPTGRLDNQRFYLARLIGCAVLAPAGDRLLPVTSAGTAMQKFERAFAQELLCPWAALDEYTDQHGLDDDGIADAAAHFEVSELLVLSTLVNKHKLSRDRIE